MEKSKLNSLLKRAISALVLAPVVVGAILYGWSSTGCLLLFISALLAWEWATMVPNKNQIVYALAYMMAAACTVSFASIAYTLLIMFGVCCFIALKAKGESYRKLLVLGVPYITLGVGSLVWFYVIFGTLLTLWLIVSVWAVDIGGYVVGSTLKGPKLAPRISPHKTWSGLGGAILFSVLISMLFAHLFYGDEYRSFAILGAVLAIIAQCGDLLESKVKRYLGVKDSSNLIPGHGGIFDRIDGLLFAAPFMLIIFIFFIM